MPTYEAPDGDTKPEGTTIPPKWKRNPTTWHVEPHNSLLLTQSVNSNSIKKKMQD